MAQTLLALLWCAFWFICAAFLLSQVPDSVVPSGFFTYSEAAGNETVPGLCTGSWPSGSAWRYHGNLSAEDDPCSGNRGDTAGIEPRCWRCAPPRYAFDY